MKCRIDKLKLNIENVLRDYQQDEIDILLFCNENILEAQKVFKYLVDFFLNINENSSEDYINKILIGIISYIEMCNRIKYELSDCEKEMIISLKNHYEEYLKKYDTTSDSIIIDNLDKIQQLIDNNALSVNERIMMEKCMKLSHLVDALEEKIVDLTAQIKIYEEKISKFEVKNNKLDKDNQELNKRINNLKEELKSLKKLYDQLLIEKDTLIQSINAKNIDIELLQTKVLELNENNSSLNENIINLENEIKKYY